MLNAKQLRQGLRRVGLKDLPADFEEIIEEVDEASADNGVLDYSQFVAITLKKKQVLQETTWGASSPNPQQDNKKACVNTVNDADCDGDGRLIQAEVEDAEAEQDNVEKGDSTLRGLNLP